MWACFRRVMLLSESTFAIPCHMTDLNRYRREASSLFIEMYRSVLLGHGILLLLLLLLLLKHIYTG